MTPAPSTTQEKLSTVAASITGTLHDAAQDAKPVFERTVDRLSDSISDMAHHSRDAAVEAQKLLEKKTQKVTSTAEHYIHCAPFKSLLIAAGVGAAAATLVSWLTRSRPH
jgi:ElaB/YqjD/DUF883 family membrane-anchored ribosome-binding protein